MVGLGVNIDHIATLRQQRRGKSPDPVVAAQVAEAAGADGIVAHLREDRRHIQDHDIERLVQKLSTRLALEMAATDEMISIACALRPHRVCLVPERREELTTEGGLDVVGHPKRLEKMIQRLREKKIEVSVFINAELASVESAKKIGAQMVEFHTGPYAESLEGTLRDEQLEKLKRVCAAARAQSLRLHAGHGLDYKNVQPVARIEGMEELNIGYSIVSRALFVGLSAAVSEMKELLN